MDRMTMRSKDTDNRTVRSCAKLDEGTLLCYEVASHKVSLGISTNGLQGFDVGKHIVEYASVSVSALHKMIVADKLVRARVLESQSKAEYVTGSVIARITHDSLVWDVSEQTNTTWSGNSFCEVIKEGTRDFGWKYEDFSGHASYWLRAQSLVVLTPGAELNCDIKTSRPAPRSFMSCFRTMHGLSAPIETWAKKFRITFDGNSIVWRDDPCASASGSTKTSRGNIVKP